MKATRICKICGKEYPFCRTERPNGTFVYQEVACCKEHAKEYFAQIAASRQGESNIQNENKAIKPEEHFEEAEVKNETPSAGVIIEEDENIEFISDEDFYDDDENDLDEDDE